MLEEGPQVACKACSTLIREWDATSTDTRFPRPFEGESKGLCEDCKARLYLQRRAGLQIAYRQWLINTYPTPSYIYGLIDPRSRDVCYIGRTANVAKRINDHRTDKKRTLEGSMKRAWVNGLHELGLTFEHCVLAVVEPGYKVIEMEARWISLALDRGWPLTNKEAYENYTPMTRRRSLGRHKENYWFECSIKDLYTGDVTAMAKIEAYVRWCENMPQTLPYKYAYFHLI